MRTELQRDIRALGARGVTPGLAAVLVGDDPASATYVRMKGKACDEAGLYHETIRLAKETTEAELLALVERLNADHKIHGILVQLPLPKQINTQRVLHRVSPEKDVDGFHPENVGKVSIGDPTGFRPATPYGVQQLLVRSGVETTGSHVVIVGRSTIVGRPMAALLLQDGPGGNATVTVCHSRTRDIKSVTRRARAVLEAGLAPLWVRGEISGFKAWQSGHWYFTLRDKTAQIRCVMFQKDNRRLPAAPQDGMQVFVFARPTVWEEKGEFRLTVLDLLSTEAGGLWQLAFEKAKAALAKDGLLDPARKRPLPPYPRRIAVITSPDGAGGGPARSQRRRDGARAPGCAAGARAGRALGADRRATRPHARPPRDGDRAPPRARPPRPRRGRRPPRRALPLENPRARLRARPRRGRAGAEARRPAHAGARVPAARHRRRTGRAHV